MGGGKTRSMNQHQMARSLLAAPVPPPPPPLSTHLVLLVPLNPLSLHLLPPLSLCCRFARIQPRHLQLVSLLIGWGEFDTFPHTKSRPLLQACTSIMSQALPYRKFDPPPLPHPH